MLERYRRWTLVSLVGFMPALALAGPATQPFTLGKYIPDDCWMLIHGVHNPERDFIVCANQLRGVLTRAAQERQDYTWASPGADARRGWRDSQALTAAR